MAGWVPPARVYGVVRLRQAVDINAPTQWSSWRHRRGQTRRACQTSLERPLAWGPVGGRIAEDRVGRVIGRRDLDHVIDLAAGAGAPQEDHVAVPRWKSTAAVRPRGSAHASFGGASIAPLAVRPRRPVRTGKRYAGDTGKQAAAWNGCLRQELARAASGSTVGVDTRSPRPSY